MTWPQVQSVTQTIADKDVYKVKVLLFCTQASLLWAELKSNHSLGFTFSDLLLASNTNIPCVFIIIDVFFFSRKCTLDVQNATKNCGEKCN